MSKPCLCGHDEDDHAADGCGECSCFQFHPDPDAEPEEPEVVFD